MDSPLMITTMSDFPNITTEGYGTHSMEPVIVPRVRAKLTEYITIAITCYGIPANLFVVFVIGMTPKMRKKRFNKYIIHQSIIDCFACLATLMSQFFNDVNVVPERYQMIYCKWWVDGLWTVFFILVSSCNLTLLSAERCWAITGNYS